VSVPTPVYSEIVPNFDFEGDFIQALPYNLGHINDTHTAYYRRRDGRVQRFILQRINHYVFKKPEEVMENIAAITEYQRSKISAAGGDPGREALTLIPTRDGGAFYRTDGGDYWRVYHFIEGAQTYQIPESARHVISAGRAFGNFQHLLRDFPVGQLHETIPDFHHTMKRFDTFVGVVESDTCNRARSAKDEIQFVLDRAEETSVVINLIERGELPVRVTHNDTKFNNVMIDDRTGEGVCVIDLDTVMPGASLYDFGDAIRSIANTAEEDERDLSKVRFDLDVFAHYTRGYLEAMGQALTPAEYENLAFSSRLMTLECGMRFLADYLSGDVYFRIQRADQNLDRCRTQFKLVREMEEKFESMLKIVEVCRIDVGFL
jgi:Ser/Thr protein kinase RdoA (MazF antagonist)